MTTELTYLVQILLPLFDNQGKPQPSQLFAQVRQRLADAHGGVTAYLRSPAEGLWRDERGRQMHDNVVIYECMCSELDRQWWAVLREELESAFQQQSIVLRAMHAQTL